MHTPSILPIPLISSTIFAFPAPPLHLSSLPSVSSRIACSSAVTFLVSGINKNIAIQKQEQSQTISIQKILSADTVDNASFQSAKGKLVDIVNRGISVRTNNQKIAPSGNMAVAGLGKVATAQAGELKLTQALTGKPATDNANLSKLQTMFSGGITQNQQNTKDVTTGCLVLRMK